MTNLLIAQMADTYSRITAEGLLRWQYERAQLISEYKDTKKPLPPPLNVIYMLLANLSGICSCCGKDLRVREGFKLIPTSADLRHWMQQEQIALKLCLTQREVEEQGSTESKFERMETLLQKQEESTRRRFEHVNSRLDTLIKLDSERRRQ
eukprot:CAMPEP_0181182344 /NCGR_PEP_ID=MMETSP1096-20121128/7840_1 /TAXON_ID=156174 ORGANISM="Chrysochromulina ericina, Strain CCMP281" /NCGR_SAMPLE_ID=MMETSP1096 /ASSEMBLY_ACC=CAM_ASM_000453 /LENGTH=150 /DNA_ID=CAMNT_0023270947 /DNA_START=5 /DNA_END=457 /DNA_ORIENTATION=+